MNEDEKIHRMRIAFPHIADLTDCVLLPYAERLHDAHMAYEVERDNRNARLGMPLAHRREALSRLEAEYLSSFTQILSELEQLSADLVYPTRHEQD